MGVGCEVGFIGYILISTIVLALVLCDCIIPASMEFFWHYAR